MTHHTQDRELISFKRRGDIMRAGIRVGWIERRENDRMIEWGLRFTPASGLNPPVRWFGMLSMAKSSARFSLTGEL